MKILFLGETYRADAQTWIKGIEANARVALATLEVKPTKIRWIRVMNLGLFFFQILKINQQKWDLVLAERSTSYGFFSLFVRAKVRAVAQQGITDAYPVTGFSGKLKRFLKRQVYLRADIIHAWGHVMVPAMLNAGAPPSKILVLPKGIDLNQYKKFKSPHLKKIGIVTRSLFPDYRHQDIIKAAQILTQSTDQFEIWIVGDGILKDELAALSQNLGIVDKIKFLGRIPNDHLPLLLAQSDFYLSVPISEGVSASLFEAMATHNFPIVSDLPAYQAFIQHGSNGLIAPVGSPEDLARHMLTFIQNPDFFAAGIHQNRKYIEEKVDFEKNMKEIFQRYNQLIIKK